jgi:hypothetical protein
LRVGTGGIAGGTGDAKANHVRGSQECPGPSPQVNPRILGAGSGGGGDDAWSKMRITLHRAARPATGRALKGSRFRGRSWLFAGATQPQVHRWLFIDQNRKSP